MIDISDINLRQLIEEETGERFNKQGFIKCCLHNEKSASLSVKFYPNSNKYKFKCFGCGATGDAIDFIMKYKKMNYVQAREHLGFSVEKTPIELQIEKINKYIEWQLKNNKKGYKLLGIFPFVDHLNNVMYYKVKFRKPDGGKETPYYHIESDKVINNRGCNKEYPYNLYSVLKAIENNDVIIITEGEKDCNTINNMLKKGYQATSIKNVKDLEYLKGCRIYCCGDTGDAGEKYKQHVYKELFKESKEFKFIRLPGIKKLGDNKDVTDWLESGHTTKDLLEAFNKSLDLKNKCELQQDKYGLYKHIYITKDDEYKRINLSNFSIIRADSIKHTDDDMEEIELTFKTSYGDEITRRGYVTVLDDLRSFKNFLNSINLVFKGKSEDLNAIKEWIAKYFIEDSYEVVKGNQFIARHDELLFASLGGAIGSSKVYNNLKSHSDIEINTMDITPISKGDLENLIKYLFEFADHGKTYSIIGTVINNLLVYQAINSKVNMHHLLIVGESGSGKTTILKNVIAPLLNYPVKDIKSIGLITPFALINELSEGNYTVLFDEFKPSSLDNYKTQKLSETLRNLYDRATVSRSDKTLTTKKFQLKRPLIVAGEESYKNEETALIERSCIVYLSKNERTAENTEAMEYLIDNEELLNKLCRSLVDMALNLNIEEYKKMRKSVIHTITGLKNRHLNTAVNICLGMEFLNRLLSCLSIPAITNYVGPVIQNIRTEILSDREDTYSVVENMMIRFNDLVESGRIDVPKESIIKEQGEGIYIRTNEMITQLRLYNKNTGVREIILSNVDFRKQAEKSGYLLQKTLQRRFTGKNLKWDLYSKSKIRKLQLDSIAEPELLPIYDGKTIPFSM